MKNILFLLISFSALFAAKPAISQPSARIAGGPYLQNVTPDGFTMIWTTTTDAAVWVETAPDDGTHFYAAERPKYYDSHLGRRRLGKLHRVRVGGLEPGKTYRYRIMQQAVLSDEGNKRVVLGEGYGSDILKHAPYPVTTPSADRNELEFWMVNDIHGRDSVFRLLIGDAPRQKPDFVCLNGDLLNSIESEKALFEGFLASASELLTPAGIPLVVTRGNHDGRGKFARHWLDYFPTPTGESYYTFRRGPVFFVVLDGCEDKPDSDIRYYGLSTADAYREQQAQWLRGVVAGEEFRSAPYRIVLIHMPPNKGRGWHGELEIERLFLPILDGSGIDLMLCGHYHRYQWIDDLSRGADFPILINSNSDKTVVTAGAKGIDIRVVDTAGDVVKEHKIPRNNR